MPLESNPAAQTEAVERSKKRFRLSGSRHRLTVVRPAEKERPGTVQRGDAVGSPPVDLALRESAFGWMDQSMTSEGFREAMRPLTDEDAEEWFGWSEL